jgi:hypothetical protein
VFLFKLCRSPQRTTAMERSASDFLQRVAPKGPLPPRKVGQLAPRHVTERIMAQTRASAKQTTYALHMTTTAPLTHGPAPDLSCLAPIALREAAYCVNTIQEHRAVFVRTVGVCARIVGTTMMVEDPEDTEATITLNLYNFVLPCEDPQDRFPPSTYLAILEPYMRHRGDDPNCPLAIRCDNPQHIVVFEDPEAWRRAKAGLEFSPGRCETTRRILGTGATVESKASQLCNEGNEQFRTGAVASASRMYSEALLLCADDVRSLSNRCATNISQGFWDAAISDARRVLRLEPTHEKCNYRLALALLCAQRVDEADAIVRTIVKNSRTAGTTEQQRVAAELEQDVRVALLEQKGTYDFAELMRQAGAHGPEASHAHLSRKHADFEHPELSLLPCSTGQGMFIRSDTPAFTLLLVSKAFVFMPMMSATDVRFTTIAHDKGHVKTTANLLYETVIRALADHPEYCREFYSLAAGEPWDSTPLSSDHSERVDVRRIMATLRCNSFSARCIRGSQYNGLSSSLGSLATDEDDAESSLSGSGVWFRPSRFNHSCSPNLSYFLIGDFIFVYNTKAVVAGEQLCHSYISPQQPFARRTKALACWGGCGFECCCQRCAATRASTPLLEIEHEVQACYDTACSMCCAPLNLSMKEALVTVMPETTRNRLVEQLSAYPITCQGSVCIMLELEGGACLAAGEFTRAESSLRELMALQATLYGKGCAFLITGVLLISAIVSSESETVADGDKRALVVMQELFETFCISHVDGLSKLDLHHVVMRYCTSSKCMLRTGKLLEEATQSRRPVYS